MKAKDTTPGTRHVAPLKWPTGRRPQFKPQVAQTKSRAVVTSVSVGRERNSSPTAPLAYRPQPVPKVLQLKRHEVKKLGGIATPQNAVRSPFTPPAPQKVLPKRLTPPGALRHQAATGNRAVQSSRPAKLPCVQAKTSSSLPSRPLAWSIPKHPSANVASRSIQLAAKAKLKVEAGEVEAKAEVKKGGTLSEIARRIHLAAGGSPDKNTTGVARLKSGQLVVVTQLVLSKVVKAAAKEGIHTVTKTNGAGYHCEVSLFIKYGNKIKAIGASQGFCPHCAEFLLAKGISMVGELREADDQVWFCPEYFGGKEKEEGAKYPWAKMLAQPENERIIFDTKAEFATWYKSRTGDDLPW